MLDFLLQVLALYLFFAVAWFVPWLANGGKREDVFVPILGSALMTSVFLPLVYLFA